MSLTLRRSALRPLTSRIPQQRCASTISSQANELAQKAAEADGGNKRADMGDNEPKEKSFLNKGAKRDPELYILLGIMSGAFGLAGYFFTNKPTAASSEAPIGMAEGTMPWQQDGVKGNAPDEHSKYGYHPGGDPSRGVKDAPSALHTTIIPNVTLRRADHKQFNKYGKDDW